MSSIVKVDFRDYRDRVRRAFYQPEVVKALATDMNLYNWTMAEMNKKPGPDGPYWQPGALLALTKGPKPAGDGVRGMLGNIRRRAIRFPEGLTSYFAHQRCHWIAGWSAQIGKILHPEWEWGIISGIEHSVGVGYLPDPDGEYTFFQEPNLDDHLDEIDAIPEDDLDAWFAFEDSLRDPDNLPKVRVTAVVDFLHDLLGMLPTADESLGYVDSDIVQNEYGSYRNYVDPDCLPAVWHWEMYPEAAAPIRNPRFAEAFKEMEALYRDPEKEEEKAQMLATKPANQRHIPAFYTKGLTLDSVGII